LPHSTETDLPDGSIHPAEDVDLRNAPPTCEGREPGWALSVPRSPRCPINLMSAVPNLDTLPKKKLSW